ncbi:hypothetical protein D2U14_07570 [Lacticaseibacillus paracasei]|nr:hypothetical protein D2U14_07570 [Lacticaseibacillus paracasei]
MAGFGSLRPRSLHSGFCACERVSVKSVMAGFWPLRSRSLHVGFWAGERERVYLEIWFLATA